MPPAFQSVQALPLMATRSQALIGSSFCRFLLFLFLRQVASSLSHLRPPLIWTGST